ncbi:MAG: hypothetical protein U1E78_08915 [Gammaproteobacteria bacterium]
MKEFCDLAEGVKSVGDKYISYPIQTSEKREVRSAVRQVSYQRISDELNDRLMKEFIKIQNLSEMYLDNANLSAGEKNDLRAKLIKQKVVLTKIQAEIINSVGIEHPSAKQIAVAFRQIDRTLEDRKALKRENLSLPSLSQFVSDQKIDQRSSSLPNIKSVDPSSDVDKEKSTKLK